MSCSVVNKMEKKITRNGIVLNGVLVFTARQNGFFFGNCRRKLKLNETGQEKREDLTHPLFGDSVSLVELSHIYFM